MIEFDDRADRVSLRGILWGIALSIPLWGLICFAAFAQAGAGGPQPNVVGSQYLVTPNAVADKQLVPLKVGNDGSLYVNATVAAGGTVTVVQPTASNLNATVAQATAGNLNATVVGTGTFAVQAAPTAATTGGASSSFLQPTASDNHAVIKNGAGTLYGVMATNNSVTINYLRYYNLGTGFNGCNSATGLITQVAILPSGGISAFIPVGIAFSTGLSICVTSAYATTDTTNATASAMSITTVYQ